MRMSLIRVEYAERKGGKEKFFSAKAIRNGDTIRTKTKSISDQKTKNDAYMEIIEEARILSKTYGLEFSEGAMKDIIDAYTNRNKRQGTSKSKQKETVKSMTESPRALAHNDHVDSLLDKFSNQLKYKAFIKQLIKLKGLQRAVEVFEEGLNLIKEIQEAALSEQRAISKANEEMARIIIQTRQSGIDMAAPNSDIEDAIRRLSSKRVGSSMNNMEGEYEYKGEKWNGVGSMPGSYSAYLRENENHKIEDLLKTNQIKKRAVA